MKKEGVSCRSSPVDSSTFSVERLPSIDSLLSDDSCNSSINIGSINEKVKWSDDEKDRLCKAIEVFGEKKWKLVSQYVMTKTNVQCRQRWLKCTKPGIKKGKWSATEDKLLETLMSQPFKGWQFIADVIPGRTPKQCRERWNHYVHPNVNKAPFSQEEDALLRKLFEEHGHHWAIISQKMPGRTETQVRFRVDHLRLTATRIWKHYQKSSFAPSSTVQESKRLSLFDIHRECLINIDELESEVLESSESTSSALCAAVPELSDDEMDLLFDALFDDDEMMR